MGMVDSSTQRNLGERPNASQMHSITGQNTNDDVSEIMTNQSRRQMVISLLIFE